MPLDIAIGLFLAFLTHAEFNIPFTPLLALTGVAAALLPDIDIVTALFGRWRHREFTHFPLMYIPIAIALFLLLPFPYAALITLGILAHFIHDTVGTGWGISWLWPFTSRRFLILPDGARRKEMGIFATWLPEEKPQWAHQGAHGWVWNTYFKPSTTAVIEYGLLMLALITLAAYLW